MATLSTSNGGTPPSRVVTLVSLVFWRAQADGSFESIRGQVVAEIGAVDLVERKFNRPQRAWVVDLEREGEEAPVLKALRGRAGDPDMPWLGIKGPHPAGESGPGHKHEPARVVPHVPREAPDRCRTPGTSHVGRHGHHASD